MTASKAERSMQASAAASTRWSRVSNRADELEPARRGLLDRFERQVDPNGEFTPEVRARMAASARNAFYKSLAVKSAAARRKRSVA